MFSAEPCRRVAYSSDLRWRIVWRRIGLEQSFRDIAQSPVYMIIFAIIFENPNLYLKIIQKIFEYTNERVSPSTVCNVMRKHGLTRNKIQRIALQRSASHRGAYIAEMSMYKASMLVFADETGKDGRD